jgi:hypothetical protein
MKYIVTIHILIIISLTSAQAVAGEMLPLYMATPAEICSPLVFRDANGDRQMGVKDCVGGVVTDCSADGQADCKSNAAFKAAQMAGVNALDIATGKTIAGLSGTGVTGPGSCSADGGINCVVDGASYKAAAVTNLVAGNIKSGVTIAGAAGNIVASPADCSADGAINCVTTAGYKSANMTNTVGGNIKNGITIAGMAGTVVPRPADCGADGATGCVTTAGYKSANMAATISGNIKNSITIAGTSGTVVPSPADCSLDGATGCVTTASFKSANMTAVAAGNIRSGITIAGVAGQYPNASHQLTGSSITSDLTSTSFNAQIKSSTAFEYWDSAGARQTGAGDVDIMTNYIASGADIFGVTGIATSGAAPNSWDVRTGVTLNSTVGKLPVNCRNTANLGVYDARMPAVGVSGPAASSGTWTITDGVSTVSVGDKLQLIAGTPPGGFSNGSFYFVVSVSSNTFALSATAGGAVITASSAGSGTTQLIKMGGGTVNIWDTIDDYNAYNTGLPSQLVAGWSVDTKCSGIESTFGDTNIWRDVTTTGDGVTSSTCSGSASNCSYLDKISGLEWSKATSKNWAAAVTYCDGLTHNGKSDWRIPTQKELMNAAEHGIRSTQSSNFVGSFAFYFWSGSTTSYSENYAWYVDLAYGYTYVYTKSNTTNVICVRP